MQKIKFLYLFLFIFSATSFVGSTNPDEFYDLNIEAGGCYYQISVNEKTIFEGKTYQNIEKKIRINEHLTEDGEQSIDVHMFRISREMSLKATKGFVKLTLEKSVGDSVVMTKELKLPTFQYDENEMQPQSISGSIQFILKKSDKSNEKPIEKE